ncbi:MAG: CBS domain-containing protein [bacterium]|nr:CBS domain-containing protein [bacterium]
MAQQIPIKDFMTKNVLVVHPETPLLDAAKIIIDHSFNGLPVVDKNNEVVGILTQYDLVGKGSILHLPTLQYIAKNLQPAEQSQFKAEGDKISDLTVGDVMRREHLTLNENDSMETAIELFANNHINPVPVIDAGGKLVGLISRFDLIKPLMTLHPGQ